MSKPVTINWYGPDNFAICNLQSRGSAGALILNGTGVNNTNTVPYFAYTNISRSVMINSDSNNSGVNFTITGTLDGEVVSETRAGPNATRVETTQLFDTVTSVTTNAATVGTVSIGTGFHGYTTWLLYNYNSSVSSLSVAVGATSVIDYSFEYTFTDPGAPEDNLIDDTIAIFEGFAAPDTSGGQAFVVGMKNETDDSYLYVNAPLRFYRVIVNSSSDDGALQAIFVQQGSNS